jgi:hypothetical protein
MCLGLVAWLVEREVALTNKSACDRYGDYIQRIHIHMEVNDTCD